jgi:four helix bundle protein
MKKSLIKEKSYEFALDVIELYKFLLKQNEYVISKQLLKSGTSIGANVEEALAGQSRADLLSKMSIASKESRETKYWLRLLSDSGFVNKERLKPLIEESESIIKILSSIVKTTGNNPKLKTKNSKLTK